MDLSKYKSTKKGAAKKVAEIFEKTRKKQPSERLIKIISEVGLTDDEKNKNSDDRAAKEADL
jgi:hypothetical protein